MEQGGEGGFESVGKRIMFKEHRGGRQRCSTQPIYLNQCTLSVPFLLITANEVSNDIKCIIPL